MTIPVQVVADAQGCSTFTNSASATYVHGYGEHFSSESNDVTLSVGCADLVIDKAVTSGGPTVVGGHVTYDISVSLADVSHPVPVKPVVITDDIDETRFAFVSATDGGTYANGVVTWTLADGLSPGDPATTVSLTLEVLSPGQDPSPVYANTACVALAPGDDTPVVKPGDDCDTATIPPPGSGSESIDLSLGKLVNGVSTTTVPVGATVTYSLAVSNAGPDDATGVVVEDTLPPGVTFVEQTGGDGTLSADGSTWTVGSVPAGDSATVTFTATVDSAGTHTNVAEITEADQPDTDSTPGNGCEGAAGSEDDCAEATVIADEAAGGLSLVKSNNPTGTLDGYLTPQGDPRTIAYALTATAGAGAVQSDVVVTDTVPAGTALVAGSLTCDGAGPCATTVAGSDLSWAIGDLAAGTSRTVRFTVTVLPPTADQAAAGSWTITNAGLATSTTDEAPSNEVDNEVVVGPSTLAIHKANDPTGVVAFGSTVVYTLTVSVPTTGGSPQTGVVVTDTIPGYDPGQPTSGTATYVAGSADCVGATPPAGTCVITETKDGSTTTGLTWALGTMGPGETRQVTYSVTLEEQEAVVAGSETVDFINVGAVASDTQPPTPSNEVSNTAVITEVSDNEVTDEGDLPGTGSALPLARLGIVGLLLVGLGTVLVRQPSLWLAPQQTPRHKAR